MRAMMTTQLYHCISHLRRNTLLDKLLGEIWPMLIAAGGDGAWESGESLDCLLSGGTGG
jgi:hypothetical protein